MLVLGVTGMVGHAVAEIISSRSDSIEVYGTHRHSHPLACIASRVRQVCDIDATNLDNLEKLMSALN